MRTRTNARRPRRRAGRTGGGGDAAETKSDGDNPVDVGLELQAVLGNRMSVELFDDERSPSVTNPMYGRHSVSVSGDARWSARLEQRVSEAEVRADNAEVRADNAESAAQQWMEHLVARVLELEQMQNAHTTESGGHGEYDEHGGYYDEHGQYIVHDEHGEHGDHEGVAGAKT